MLRGFLSKQIIFLFFYYTVNGWSLLDQNI